MLRYFPVPAFAEGLCGLGYRVETGETPVTVRLPALVAQVQVTLSGSIRHDIHDAGDGPDPSVSLVGPASAAADVVIGAGSRVIGIGLPPAGWLRAVGASAGDMADRIVAADAVWGRAPVATLLEEMQAAGEDAEAARLLFRFAATRRASRQTACAARIALTTEWLGRAGTVEIGLLADRLDLSLRQTERFTSRVFGARPKLLEMKYRSLKLAAASAIGGARVYDVQTDHLVESFYDQSHLIRNFRRFVGHSPCEFDRQADFARAMLHGRWQSGARSPVMLWS